MKNLLQARHIFLGICCAIFISCGDSKVKEDTYYTQLIEAMPVVVSLESAKIKGDIETTTKALETLQDMKLDSKVSEDALHILQRAQQIGYTIILPNELASSLESYTIISTLPRGVYNLGLIPNAKHFEFALSPSFDIDENKSEWNWEADGLSRSQEEFISLLGEDKNAKIVFYDSGEYVFSPMGSAIVGIIWAKKLGYNNVYRLVGGFNAWKDLKLPISTKAPQCCQM